MIRLIFVLLFVFLFLILSMPLMLAEWIIGKISPSLRDRSSLAIVNWAFRCVIFLSGTRVIVKGEENVPKDTAVLYVGNHRSYYDIILTYVRVPRPTGYVAKLEMLRYPLLNVWMHFLHCLFLDRNDLKKGLKTILKGVEKVKSGISICIFPEGTRSRDGKMQPFKEGSMKMATKTGCAIVPIAISNSAEIMENHFPKIRPCRVIVEYGAPIYPKELSKEEQKFIGAYTQKQIQSMLDRHQIT